MHLCFYIFYKHNSVCNYLCLCACVLLRCVCVHISWMCFLTRTSAKLLQGVLVQCAVCAVFCVLCVVWCALCTVLCAVCVLCVLCAVRALCAVLCVVCCALCACSCHRRVLFSCGLGGAHTTTLSLKIQEDLERIESIIKCKWNWKGSRWTSWDKMWSPTHVQVLGEFVNHLNILAEQ